MAEVPTGVADELKVGAVTFRVGDRIEYWAPNNNLGKKCRGIISMLHTPDSAQVSDETSKGQLFWFVHLGNAKKL